jgi:hypothetical protein
MITINNKKMIAHNSTREFSDALDLRYVHERRLEKKYIYIYIYQLAKELEYKRVAMKYLSNPKSNTLKNSFSHTRQKELLLLSILWQRVVFSFYVTLFSNL